MSYAIVGFGKIGQALAHAFARKDIDVTVACRSLRNMTWSQVELRDITFFYIQKPIPLSAKQE